MNHVEYILNKQDKSITEFKKLYQQKGDWTDFLVQRKGAKN